MVWNIFYFPIYWEFHHPNWLSYFSEGWPNHQPEMLRECSRWVVFQAVLSRCRHPCLRLIFHRSGEDSDWVGWLGDSTGFPTSGLNKKGTLLKWHRKKCRFQRFSEVVGGTPNWWFKRENPIKMDENWGYPFLGNLHVGPVEPECLYCRNQNCLWPH